jgi:hypothetical protein
MVNVETLAAAMLSYEFWVVSVTNDDSEKKEVTGSNIASADVQSNVLITK